MNMNSKKKSQGGFTLIELAVVVVIIGILLGVLVSSMRGSTDGPNALALDQAADQSDKALSMLGQFCGVSTAVTGNPLPDTGATLEDVVFTGVSKVAPAYKNCYAQSKVKALTKMSQPGSVGGIYNVAGYQIKFVGGGTAPLQVQYLKVKDEITLALAQKYTPNLTALAASDTSSPVVQYSTAAADGTRTVTVFQQ